MSRRFWIKDYIDILVVVPKNPNLTYWKTVEPTTTSSFTCWHNEIFQNLFFNPHDDDDDDDELAKNLQPLSICCEQHSYLHSDPKSKIHPSLFVSKIKIVFEKKIEWSGPVAPIRNFKKRWVLAIEVIMPHRHIFIALYFQFLSTVLSVRVQSPFLFWACWGGPLAKNGPNLAVQTHNRTFKDTKGR